MWLTLRTEARLVASQWRVYGLVAFTLALGLAVASTMTSVADSVVWRPVRAETADRLVTFEAASTGTGNWAPISVSPEQIRHLQHVQPSRLVGIAGSRSTGAATMPLTAGSRVTSVRTATVTPGFFPLFNLPEIWTSASADSDERVVVSHALWARVLRSAGIGIGDTISVDAFDPATFGTRPRPLRIAAIAPPGFHFPGDTDVWLPVTAIESRFPHFSVIGLLPPGHGPTQADVPSASWDALRSVASGDVRARSLADAVAPREAPLLLLLLGAAGALLLGVWFQTALFTASEVLSKRRAIETRMSLGASHRRLVGELLVGPALVIAIAVPLSLPLASWMHRDLVAYLPFMAGRRAEFGAVAMTSAALIAVLFLAGQAALLTSVVRRRARAGTWRAMGVTRMPSAIAAGAAAVSVAVLYASLLLATSFTRTLTFDYGFETDGLVAIHTSAMVAGLQDQGRQQKRLTGLETFARQQPGVTGVVRLNGLPFGPYDVAQEVSTAGDTPRAMTARVRETAPGLFNALRVPIVAGRDFLPEEPDAAPVAIVTRSVAETLWPETTAIDAHLSIDGLRYRVIGIVSDFSDRASRGQAPLTRPQVFLLSRQGSEFLLRTSGNADAALVGILAYGEAHAAYLRVDGFAYPARREALAGNERAYARFMGMLAITAMLLAALGGVATVAQAAKAGLRSAAIRLGLGASRRQALFASTFPTLASFAIGAVAGIAMGVAAGHILQSAIRNVQSPEAPAIAACVGVAALLLAGTIVAPIRVIRGVDIAALLKDER